MECANTPRCACACVCVRARVNGRVMVSQVLSGRGKVGPARMLQVWFLLRVFRQTVSTVGTGHCVALSATRMAADRRQQSLLQTASLAARCAVCAPDACVFGAELSLIAPLVGCRTGSTTLARRVVIWRRRRRSCGCASASHAQILWQREARSRSRCCLQATGGTRALAR